MDTVVVEDFETAFIQMGEIFPLLTALSPLPLEEKGQDFNMNNLPLSLCDVQLMTDWRAVECNNAIYDIHLLFLPCAIIQINILIHEMEALVSILSERNENLK